MTKMTELEAWKLIYAWTKAVPASVHPQFKEARALFRKSINRVEKANSDRAAAMRMIRQAMAEQGYVLVWPPLLKKSDVASNGAQDATNCPRVSPTRRS